MATNIVPFDMSIAQQLSDSVDAFPVDFDEAWVWLGYSTKASAFRNLQKFEEGVDFSTTTLKNPAAGRPSLSIRLTTNCFKEMGMLAGTPQGKQVRKYFLECERIAKTTGTPKTPIQVLQQIVNQMADNERAVLALEEKQQVLTETQITLATRLEVVEAEHYRVQNPSGSYYTVVAYASLNGYQLSVQQAGNLGRMATRLCKAKGFTVEKLPDPRFGTVNTYPLSVLVEVFQQHRR